MMNRDDKSDLCYWIRKHVLISRLRQNRGQSSGNKMVRSIVPESFAISCWSSSFWRSDELMAGMMPCKGSIEEVCCQVEPVEP